MVLACGVTAVSRTGWLGTSGVCWALPLQHSHTVRATKFHGLQFKAEGQEALMMMMMIIIIYS